MSNENRKSTGEGKRFNQEHIEAAFCEEVLECLICEKIYFSRRPIKLATLQKKTFHVCLPCSEIMLCSMCSQPVTTETALFIENLPDACGGLLCPRCRDKLFLSFRASPPSIGGKLRAAVAVVLAPVSFFLHRILNFRIWPR